MKTLFVCMILSVTLLYAQTIDTWRVAERNTIEEAYEYISETQINYYTDYTRETVSYSQSYPDVINSVSVQTRRQTGTDPGTWIHVYTAHFNPEVIYHADRRFVTYNVDSFNYFHNRRNEVYDNHNRLIQVTNSIVYPDNVVYYYARKTYFYRPDNNIDSLFTSVYEAGKNPFYVKFISEYDPQGIKTSEIKYYSPDSLNWVQQEKKLFAYTNTMYPQGFHFHLDNPLFDFMRYPWLHILRSFDQGLVTPLIVDSVIVQHSINSTWQDRKYYRHIININPNNKIDFAVTEIDLSMVPFPPDYIPPQGYFSFDYNGNFLSQYRYYDDGFFPPWSKETIYTWQHIVANDNQTETPAVIVSISAYPNPFKADLNIKIDSKEQKDYDICIYNIKGQLIRSWKDIRADELTWDGKDKSNNPVSSGVYIIKARQGKDSSTLKVIRY